MKTKLKKIFIVFSIVVLLFSIIMPIMQSNTVYADAQSDEADRLSAFDVAGEVLDGVFGLLVYPLKLLVLGLASVIREIIWGITALGGSGVWSVEDIIFNESLITSINFFDINNSSTPTTIETIRLSVAEWYFAIRNLAIVIQLGVLIYVGIRMAIASVASEEAKYKKMLKDWIVSIALIFVLHYIMIFTIGANNTLVGILSTARGGTGGLGTEYDEAMDAIFANSFSIGFNAGVGSTLVYTMLVGVSMIFLVMYMKRMLTIGFLIIISPLITVTYSIDKMGDGKSQALNSWLKEFVFNVLIQPFHCVIYLAFSNVAMDLLIDDRTLASAVLAIVMMMFMFTAEKIVKKIFNFQASSLGDTIASAGFMATGISMLQKRGDKDSKKGVDTSKMPTMDSKGSGTGNVNAGANMQAANAGQSGIAGQAQGQAAGLGNGPGNTQATAARGNSQGGVPVVGAQGGPQRPNGTKKKGSRVGNAIKSFYSPRNMVKTAAAVTLASLGASTGSAKGIISGTYAGVALGRGLDGRVSQKQANKMVQNNEKAFATAATNYQNKKGLTNQQMEARTMNMLNADAKTVESMDQDDREYYEYVKNMRATYGAMGENTEDSKQRVLDTMSMVQNGDIEPDWNNVIDYSQMPAQPVAPAAEEVAEQATQAPEAVEAPEIDEPKEEMREMIDRWKNGEIDEAEYDNWMNNNYEPRNKNSAVGAGESINEMYNRLNYSSGAISFDEYYNEVMSNMVPKNTTNSQTQSSQNNRRK